MKDAQVKIKYDMKIPTFQGADMPIDLLQQEWAIEALREPSTEVRWSCMLLIAARVGNDSSPHTSTRTCEYGKRGVRTQSTREVKWMEAKLEKQAHVIIL